MRQMARGLWTTGAVVAVLTLPVAALARLGKGPVPR
jgi:hypothetical protein